MIDIEPTTDRLRRMIFQDQRDAWAGDRDASDYWLEVYADTLRLPSPQLVIVDAPRASAPVVGEHLHGLAQPEWEAGMRELLDQEEPPAEGVPEELEEAGDGSGEALPPIAPQPLDEAPPRRGKR